jgi:hypothetical protein
MIVLMIVSRFKVGSCIGPHLINLIWIDRCEEPVLRPAGRLQTFKMPVNKHGPTTVENTQNNPRPSLLPLLVY